METMSSSFSVSVIASPPSRGTTRPAKKPPVGWRRMDQNTCHPIGKNQEKLSEKKEINGPNERKRTEDSMHAHDIRHECRTEKNDDRDSHEEHGRAILNGACATSEPTKGEASRE